MSSPSFSFFFFLFLSRWNIWWSRHVKMAPWLMRLGSLYPIDEWMDVDESSSQTNEMVIHLHSWPHCLLSHHDRTRFPFSPFVLCFVLGDFYEKPTGWRDWTRLNACLSAYFSRKSNRYRLIMFFCWTKKLLVHSFDFVWQVDVRYSEFRERRSHRRAPHTHSGHYWSER